MPQTPWSSRHNPFPSPPQVVQDVPVWSLKEVPILSVDALNFQKWRSTVTAAIEAYTGTGFCTRAPSAAEKELSMQFRFFLILIVDEA